jgi:hypothetical protein
MQFNNFKGAIPNKAVNGLSAEQVLRHLIQKNGADSTAVGRDIALWVDGERRRPLL